MTNGFGSRYSIQLSYGCWKENLTLHLKVLRVLAVLRTAATSFRFAQVRPNNRLFVIRLHSKLRFENRLPHPAELRVLGSETQSLRAAILLSLTALVYAQLPSLFMI